MSDCARALEYLLDAEPDELSGRSDTEVGRHVRECDRCRAASQKVLDSTARLDAALAVVPDDFDFAAILRRAKSPESKRHTATVGPIRRRWGGIATVALAASIVGLLVLSDRDDPLPGTAVTARVTVQLPIVDAAADQDVAVIETDNPDITVLWFF